MNAEFFEALAMLEKERGLPADYLLEKIKNAIVIAVIYMLREADTLNGVSAFLALKT